MRPSLALSIGAVFNVLLGIPLVVAPEQMLSAFGLATPNEALIQARDTGVLVTGVGVIDWLARDAVGGPLRGLLWGNIFIRVAAMIVNLSELAAGVLPSTVVAVVPILFAVSGALIVVFVLALRRA
jgi:hypothetical protein